MQNGIVALGQDNGYMQTFKYDKMEHAIVEKRSYNWFEKRRRTIGLEIAQEQITKAFDTVTLLHKAALSFSEGNLKETRKHIEALFTTEEEVDKLRTNVFTELSKGSALMADYREDLLHLVKRLDTLADHTKDAARCLQMLGDTKIPEELCRKTVFMTSKLVETAQTLRASIEKISSDPTEAIAEARKVEDIEHDLDQEYLKTKSLFVKYGEKINCGAIVIYDDLIEFIEHAADMCADTADYIVILSSRE
jgi:predicted phosphate transport protein (TIGR00153 family)